MAKSSATAYHLKLSFTTWLCPEWTAPAIVDGMQTYGFDAVEFRLGKGHLHGIEVDATPDALADVRKQFDDAHLAISCLATSYNFSALDAGERRKNIEGTKQALKIADSLGAPYVRVLGGDIPAGTEPAGIVDQVSEALGEITEYIEAEKLRPTALIETHGSFAHSKYLNEVLTQVYSQKVGVLWDIAHPVRVLEKPEDTYETLGDYIRHIHVQDFSYNEERTKIAPCGPGEGFVPLARVVDMLKVNGYRGYLSVEAVGQKADPETLLETYSKYLRKLIAGPEPK